MLRNIAAQSWLLEQRFEVLIQLMKAGDGTFEFAGALDAWDKAGAWSDIVDPRERQLVLMEQSRIGLGLLTRAKLIERTAKPDFTPNLRLPIRREIGSYTRLGRVVARRSPAIRRCYLFLWSSIDRGAHLKRRWLWLIGIGQFIAWAIGWRMHVAAIEATKATIVVLCGAALSAFAAWTIKSLT